MLSSFEKSDTISKNKRAKKTNNLFNQTVEHSFNMTKNGIALVAARSGGHILPGLTLAQKINTDNPMTPLLFFFCKNNLDEHIASQSTVPATHVFIKLENIPYKNPFKLLQFFLACTSSICARVDTFKTPPDRNSYQYGWISFYTR